jgi:mono/diheme cytochrome c family protein
MPVILLALSILLAQAPQPAPAPVAPQSAGKELFAKAKCIKCHGEDGKGDTEKGQELQAPDFTSPSFQRATTDVHMTDVILNGSRDRDRKVLMPAYRDKLSVRDVQVLVGYVRSLGPGR